MKYHLVGLSFFLALSLLCLGESKKTIVSGYVNEEIITKNDVYALSGEAGLSYEQALNRLIEQQLLLQDFKDKKGRIPSAQLDVQMDSIIQESFNGNRNALAQVLKMKGQSFFGLKEEVKTSIILNVMRQQKAQSINNLSPKAIKSYYQAHINEFKIPTRYYMEQSGFNGNSKIVIAGEEKSKVDVLKKHLLEKTSIEEVKKQLDEFSIPPSWYQATELDPNLSKQLETIKIGQTTHYLKVNDVWITSKLLDKQNEHVKPLEEAQSEIEEKLLIEMNQKIYQDYIDSLKRKSVIQIIE